MRKILLPIILAMMFLCSAQGFCQDFPMQHFTVEDGLPGNRVYDAYHDSKGYMWFATDKGVARYNGINFEAFTTFNGLADNEIFSFQEDYYGRIWFATYNGQLCYFKDDTFHNAGNTPFLKLPYKVPFISHIFVENDSSVSIVFSEQSLFINIVGNRCDIYRLQTIDSNGFNYIHCVKKLNDNTFRLFFPYKEVEVNNKSQIVRAVSYHERHILADCISQAGNYILYKGGTIEDVNNGHTFRLKNTPENEVQRVYIDKNGNTFLATSKGLIINDSIVMLKGLNASSISEDDAGNYWISTLGDGVYKMSLHDVKLSKNVYNDEIKYCCLKHGRLFFTTISNNLYFFDGHKPQCLFDYKSIAPHPCIPPYEPGFLMSDDYKYYIFYGRQNLVIDNVFSRKRRLSIYYNMTPPDGIKSVTGINSSVYVQNRKFIKKIDYRKVKNGDDISTLGNITDTGIPRIFGLSKANDNAIWYSTVSDVYKLLDTVSVLQPQFKNLIFRYFVCAGSKIIGYTQDNQLLICSNINSPVVTVDSVPYQNCVWDKIFMIDTNHLLLSTNSLYRLIELSDTKVPFSISTIEDPFIPLHAEAICVDSTQCCFFKNGAVTTIATKILFIKQTPPRPFFTYLKAGNKSYRVQDEIQLPFSISGHITIFFSAISMAGKNILYQYSVSRNNKDNWHDLNGDINLINTGYGTYQVKLRAKTLSGDFSRPATFTMTILKPFWARWRFIALCIAALLGITWLLIRWGITYVIRKKGKEHTAEIKLLKSEYKALNALMNPHFIFNTLNNLQSLVNKNDKRATNEYLRVFSDLIRQNMHNISKELISLQKELDLVANYLSLEKLRFEDNLNYRIDVQENVDLTEIMIPPLLIQPLVENAVKHGIFPMQSSNGFILIKVFQADESLYIQVSDNGVGFSQSMNKKDTAHQSFGLENIRHRMAQLSIIQNKHFSLHISENADTQGNMHGTIATVTIPMTFSPSF